MSHWTIHLRPEPSDVPVEIRVRRLLKLALRRFALRCTDVREIEPTAPDSAPPLTENSDFSGDLRPKNSPVRTKRAVGGVR
jgi:hypothetical protein